MREDELAEGAFDRYLRWNRIRQAARSQGVLFRPVQDVDHRDRGVGDGAGDLDDIVEVRILAVDSGQAEHADFAQALRLVVENRRRLQAATHRPLVVGFTHDVVNLAPLQKFVEGVLRGLSDIDASANRPTQPPSNRVSPIFATEPPYVVPVHRPGS